jgi:hypothetical protein
MNSVKFKNRWWLKNMLHLIDWQAFIITTLNQR